MKSYFHGLAAILWLCHITTACVDFEMSMRIQDHEGRWNVLVEATLTDNGVQRCRLHDLDLEDFPSLLTPFAMDCDAGYWAGIAFVNPHNAVIRYAHHGFDDTFSVQSGRYMAREQEGWKAFFYPYNIEMVAQMLQDLFTDFPPGPFFRKTEWDCDYGEITAYDKFEMNPVDLAVTRRLRAKKGWNRSGPEDWKPETL